VSASATEEQTNFFKPSSCCLSRSIFLFVCDSEQEFIQGWHGTFFVIFLLPVIIAYSLNVSRTSRKMSLESDHLVSRKKAFYQRYVEIRKLPVSEDEQVFFVIYDKCVDFSTSKLVFVMY
jgi:hypothetical protein